MIRIHSDPTISQTYQSEVGCAVKVSIARGRGRRGGCTCPACGAFASLLRVLDRCVD